MKEKSTDIEIGGTTVKPGESCVIDIPVARMYTHDDLSISTQVIRGEEPGPTLFISAAIHGDEINGVEIIRRLLQHKALRSIKGTLLAIPIVNVHGFLNHLLVNFMFELEIILCERYLTGSGLQGASQLYLFRQISNERRPKGL